MVIKMKKNVKKLGAMVLSGVMLFAFASCGKNETPTATDTPSTTESTTAKETTTAPVETNTAKPTETQKPTENAKPTESAPKPTEAKPKPTEKSTEKQTEKATEAPKPQKQAPKFIFTQSFPIKVTAYDAQFDVTKASVTGGYWSGDTYIFDIRVSMKRCDDGIDGKKNGTARMTIKDSKGNVVRRTSIVVGSLAVGEEKSGLIGWSVDAPGTYTIEFSSI